MTRCCWTCSCPTWTDCSLPGGAGGSGVPILFLTALGGEKDVLRGYALGADDYVTKPMVYNFLPFMIYPIYNTLQKLDKSYVEAAQDLGANPMQVFFKAVLPLSMPGIVSGILMVFMPTISTFAIAELLTMNNIKLFGTTIQENINNSMWNYGAALSLIMLSLLVRQPCSLQMIRIIRRRWAMVRNFVSGIFVAASAIALCTYFYHYDLFVYRSKGAGQLDWVFHQTLFIPVCCGYTSFIRQMPWSTP